MVTKQISLNGLGMGNGGGNVAMPSSLSSVVAGSPYSR